MASIDFSLLTPVQIKYLSLGLKSFIDKFVAKNLNQIANIDISIPMYDFSSASLLYNTVINDAISCMPVSGEVDVKMTISEASYVNDPVFGQIFGFDLYYTYSVSPGGVIEVRTDTLVRKFIGSGYKVAHETLTDVVYAASIEVFKVKLGSSNIVEVPAPIEDTIDPNATRDAKLLMTKGMKYSEVFNFLYEFLEQSLGNFKIKYVTPYL